MDIRIRCHGSRNPASPYREIGIFSIILICHLPKGKSVLWAVHPWSCNLFDLVRLPSQCQPLSYMG